MYSDAQLSGGFTVGDWTAYPARGALVSGGDETVPEPKVFALLLALARRDGDLVSKDELIETLWDNRAMSDAPVNRCVTQLRKTLGDNERPYRYVENVPKRGYRLKEPVRLLQESERAPVAPTDNASTRNRSRLVPVAVVLILMSAAFFAARLHEGSGSDANDVQAIGVLPFADLSAEQGNRYLVDVFKEELINSLYTVPGIAVVNSRLDYDGVETGRIARRLGVDSVLEGSVQRDGSRLKVFYKLTDATDGVLLLSGSLEGDVETHFEMQTELAVEVRNALLGESGPTLITRSRPRNFAAYDSYMQGLYQLDARQTSTSLDQAIELFETTIDRDPEFGPAYLMLATAYALLPTYRGVSIDEASRRALATLEAGITVDPSIADPAAAIRGFFHHMNRRWADSEREYRRAVSAPVVDPTALLWYSRMLASVGRLDASLEYALRALRLDPTSAIVNSRVAMAYTWLGQYEKAEDYFLRAEELGAGGSTYLMAYALCLFELGDRERAFALTQRASREPGLIDDWIEPVFLALDDASKVARATEAMENSAARGAVKPQVELIVRALLSDSGGALEVAKRLAEEGEIFEMDLLFIPQTRPLREAPGFDALTDRLGLKAYWSSNDCQWQGDSFVCSG